MENKHNPLSLLPTSSLDGSEGEGGEKVTALNPISFGCSQLFHGSTIVRCPEVGELCTLPQSLSLKLIVTTLILYVFDLALLDLSWGS